VRARQKMFSIFIGALAVALTVLGISLALSDTNSSGSSDAALALHNQNPRSAHIALTISTGQQYDVTGTLDFNFVDNAARASIAVPTVFSTTNVDAILSRNYLYVGSSVLNAITKKKWIASPQSYALDLFAIEGEMAKIRVDIPVLRKLPGLNQLTTERTTHNGPFTTYLFSNQHFSLAGVSAKGGLIPQTANATVAVTVASAGQLAELKVMLVSTTSNVSLDAKVLSYNAPVTITAPPASSVQPLSAALNRKLYGSSKSPFFHLFKSSQLAQLVSLFRR
jgi:hypothetical protein